MNNTREHDHDDTDPSVEMKSNYSDEDDDSLGCALNEYNRIFHDAPIIKDKIEKARKLAKSNDKVQHFIETSEFHNSQSDDEEGEPIVSSGIEDDDDTTTDNLKQIKKSTVKSHIQKDNVYFDNLVNDSDSVNDHGIDLEFENYLNEENDLDKLITEGTENFEKFQCEVNMKIKELEKVNFQSIGDLRKMAVEKYGLVNKKFRRKAWPILISNREIYLGSNKKNSSTSLSKRSTNKKIKLNHHSSIEEDSNLDQISKKI